MAQGVVMSSMAKAFNWKDGSGKVACIRREIALQLGWAVVGKTPEQNAGTVKLAGEKVIEFSELPKLLMDGNELPPILSKSLNSHLNDAVQMTERVFKFEFVMKN